MLVDFDIVERAQAGDAQAFHEIVQAYRRRIHTGSRPTRAHPSR